ncbi:uncharacterized protein KIAA2012 homolog isoform X2 [Sphaerodactylus townsendi]|uniref:uncharacterized protein KIAA2012 homolog isoform X2 n=1 Tax=Sphaerodactylus townsendi TaxID=933632 RepID=UPI0020261269|nr:uncharacterized protein KIAA2012 homolog isoform X2 [Sphaerodactylus townsendi]
MPNLSLLSRGVGQVIRKTQEKLEVHFEPEDYLNWKSSEHHCYVTRSLDDREVMERSWGLYLPKTYSTKTGALVLYSEDLAKPSRKMKKCQRRFRSKSRTLHIELHTLQDLVRAILAYGSKQARKDQKETVWQPYLHFLSNPAIQPDRQMRPGYSAKRYLLKLLKLAQTWDPNILQKLQHAGYIKDPFVLEDNVPYHRRKPDLSAVPPKYNLLPVFCSPRLHPWVEMEKANPGLSSSMKSENEAWLVDGYEREKHARRKPQIPFRISVRKLSLHLSSSGTKGSTWRQKVSYGGTAEDPDVAVHQNLESTKEDQDPTEMANQPPGCPASEKNRGDTLDLWQEKPHVTFYGGFFPGRKISDGAVSQRHLKNSDGKEGGPSGFLPLIQPGANAKQSGVRNIERKQMPEIFRLPVISEPQLSAHRGKLKSRELPEDLTIFPLLVRLERGPHTKGKNPRGFDRSSSEAYVCSELSNDRFSKPGRRNKQRQGVSSEIPESPQCSLHLPPVSNGEFTLSSRTNTRKRESGAETNSQLQRGSIQDGIPGLSPVPAITQKKDPEDQDKRAIFETSTNTTAGRNGVCKDLPVGIIDSGMQGKRGECYSDISLSSLLVGRDGENVCPARLGSVRATGDPEGFEFVPVEEADGTESLEAKIGGSRSQPETSFSAPELDEKVIPQIQEVRRVPENENSLPNQQSIMGNGSSGAESRKEIQQSQDGFRGNNLLLQRKQKNGQSGLPKTQGPKQKEAAQVPSEQLQGRSPRGKVQRNSTPQARSSRDKGKQTENLPPSESFSHLEPSLSQWTIPESEMELDSAVMEFPSLGGELSIEMGKHSSENQAEAGENDNITLPEKPSLQTKITHSSAGDGLGNKLVTRQKKPELKKAEPGFKAQKKSRKKDERQSRTEFVVGKPKQKKSIGKTAFFSKEEPGNVKNSETPEEADKEEEQKEAEAEAEQIVSGAEEDILGETLEKSTSSVCLMEEAPLPPDDEQSFPADVECPSGFHTEVPHETPNATPPIFHTATGSQTNAVPSAELREALAVPEREDKLSREKIIAERAEKRRLAVERKRREQEELKWKQQEEQERMERMKEEMEEEKQRRIEEIRLRKQQLQEERQRQEEEEARKLHAEKAAQERLQQQQEELRRKLQEAQKRKEEEERNRTEVEKRRQKEREMWLEEERRRIAEMAEEQRVEYEKQKREEEERARREAEERRKKTEEAARRALEEARKQALLLARQRAEEEQKQQFQHTLCVEASGLERQLDISRPWVYSYFQHPFLKVGDEE